MIEGTGVDGYITILQSNLNISGESLRNINSRLHKEDIYKSHHKSVLG